MALCHVSQEYNENGFTIIDNAFIKQYMPDAPSACNSVYLFGLTLCTENEGTNTLDVMCRALNMCADDIISAYMYWEEVGLVNVFTRPELRIEYLPIHKNKGLVRRFRANKYADFTKQMQNILSARQITPSEYGEYFEFLENTLFDPLALVCVTRYCAELQGNDVGHHYILTVARNLAKGGIKSLEAVEEKLSEHPKFNDDLILILKALRLKRKHEYQDREMYDRWTKEFGFSLDCILHIAKQVKAGGMNKLNSMIEEYYKKGLFSAKEIDQYAENKEKLFDLAKTINKTIGVYYQSLEPVVDTYISQWIVKGFDEETLTTVAHYCFVSGIRTLDGMASVIDKLYAQGITSKIAFDQYIAQAMHFDEQIKGILDTLGLYRRVTVSDRMAYKTWLDKWNLPRDLIDYATTLSVGTANPMNYLNKILSSYYNEGITSVEKAKKQKHGTGKSAVKERDYEQREYTAEQLRSLFDNLDIDEL